MAKFLALVVVLMAGYGALLVASATTYNVGDSQGWSSGVDYTKWTSDKTFVVGDRLMFNYTPKAHTVTEVSKTNYDACSGRNALEDDDSGNTVVTLNTPGWHYYICTVPGHCPSGMKVAVQVSATPSGAAGRGSLVPAIGSVVAAAAGAAIEIVALL